MTLRKMFKGKGKGGHIAKRETSERDFKKMRDEKFTCCLNSWTKYVFISSSLSIPAKCVMVDTIGKGNAYSLPLPLPPLGKCVMVDTLGPNGGMWGLKTCKFYPLSKVSCISKLNVSLEARIGVKGDLFIE